eukprot:6185935-Pleurochrysis_carterae.AAC.3
MDDDFQKKAWFRKDAVSMPPNRRERGRAECSRSLRESSSVHYSLPFSQLIQADRQLDVRVETRGSKREDEQKRVRRESMRSRPHIGFPQQ